MADAVDVGDGEAGVVERRHDHGGLERPARELELSGGGGVVGDAHDGGGAAQRGHGAHRAGRYRSADPAGPLLMVTLRATRAPSLFAPRPERESAPTGRVTVP